MMKLYGGSLMGIILDEMDVNIIRTLQRDARTNFVSIAKKFDASIDTIISHFRNLTDIGVVRGSTIYLNPRMLGFECIASLEIDVDYPRVDEVQKMVQSLEGVIFCSPSSGKSDIFAIAVLKSVDRLSRLMESIKRNPMVREIAASIWVDEVRLCPENFDFDQVMRDA